MQDFFASVDSEGHVMWLAPIVMESVCHFNVRYFPYDTQFCTISIGSWIYNGLDLDLWNRDDEGEFS